MVLKIHPLKDTSYNSYNENNMIYCDSKKRFKKNRILANTTAATAKVKFPFPVGNHASNGNHFLGSHCTGSSTPSYPRLDVSLSLMGRHFGGHAHPRQLPTVTDGYRQLPTVKNLVQNAVREVVPNLQARSTTFCTRFFTVGNCR